MSKIDFKKLNERLDAVCKVLESEKNSETIKKEMDELLPDFIGDLAIYFSANITPTWHLEFAEAEKKIREDIAASLPRLVENLALIYETEKTNINHEHWKSELPGNIGRFNGAKTKKDNKFLTPEKYYDYLWVESSFANDSKKIDNVLKEKFKKEKLELNDKDIEPLKGFIKGFLFKLSERLSKGKISSEELYEMIENYKENRG